MAIKIIRRQISVEYYDSLILEKETKIKSGNYKRGDEWDLRALYQERIRLLENFYYENHENKTTFHIDSITCPECETLQTAKVEHTVPFPTYIHECKKCKHVITESEWNKAL